MTDHWPDPTNTTQHTTHNTRNTPLKTMHTSAQQTMNDQQHPANPNPNIRRPFNVVSFAAGLVFMMGGLAFLGEQNNGFNIDLGSVLPLVAIIGGLGAIFGQRHSQ